MMRLIWGSRAKIAVAGLISAPRWLASRVSVLSDDALDDADNAGAIHVLS